MLRTVPILGLALTSAFVLSGSVQPASAQRAPAPPPVASIGTAAGGPPRASPPALAASDDLRELACARHRGFPIGRALRYGPDALPALWSLLDEAATRSCWPGAILAAGIIGGPEVYPRLRRFIEATATRRAGDDAFVAMRLAFEALGFLVWRSPDSGAGRDALAYLIAGTDAQAWDRGELDWRLPDDERRYVTKVLVSSAVIGLAFTAHAAAHDRLEELLARGPEAVDGLGPDSCALVGRSLEALERREASDIEVEPGESASEVTP